MKSVTFLILFTLWFPLHLLSQGSFLFNNFANTPGPSPVTRGYDGEYVGSDYTASFLFVYGTFKTQAAFDSSNPLLFSPADTHFLGATGHLPEHGPLIDGAG